MTVERSIAHCLILTRLDYCNSVLYGLPENTLLHLTRILHQAARLCFGLFIVIMSLLRFVLYTGTSFVSVSASN